MALRVLGSANVQQHPNKVGLLFLEIMQFFTEIFFLILKISTYHSDKMYAQNKENIS